MAIQLTAKPEESRHEGPVFQHNAGERTPGICFHGCRHAWGAQSSRRPGRVLPNDPLDRVADLIPRWTVVSCSGLTKCSSRHFDFRREPCSPASFASRSLRVKVKYVSARIQPGFSSVTKESAVSLQSSPTARRTAASPCPLRRQNKSMDSQFVPAKRSSPGDITSLSLRPKQRKLTSMSWAR
jgi:hypothetical protein